MTKEEIIADERYHTCGRCKYEEISCYCYPCNKCVHGISNKQDFWELKEESEE